MELIQHIIFEDQPKTIKFSPDGSRFLAFSRNRIVSYTVEGTPEAAPIEPLIVFDADYLNDEQIVVATIIPERKHVLAIYDIATGQLATAVDTEYILFLSVDQYRGRLFAGEVSGEVDGDTIAVYDLALDRQDGFTTKCSATALAVSHSGGKLAAAGVYFEVWHVAAAPKQVSERCPQDDDCTGTPCEANCAAITPDGRYAAAGFDGARGICAVMDAASGKIMGWYGPRGDEINYYAAQGVALAPDGQFVAVALAGSATVPVYRVADGTIAYKYDVPDCTAVAFSPRGDVLALGSAAGITLWRFDPAI
jgi:WD40 repeat protein